MKAALLEAPHKMTVGAQPDPEMGPGEVLVEVAASAICGTDVSIWAGKMPANIPLIPGHECTGTVAALGAGAARLKKGDRVVLNPVTACGVCHYCLRGLTNLCLNGGLRGREVPGTFAELIAVKETEAYKIPDSVSFAAATNFVGLYTVVYSQRKAPRIPGGSVAVIGQGSSGLLHTQLAKVSGAASVIAITRSKWKLEMALKMGADEIVPAGETDPLLSGATFPITLLPDVAQYVAQFVPASYLVSGFQGIFLRGESLRDIWPSAAALAITLVVGLFLSRQLFRWDKEEKIRPAAKLWLLAVLAPFFLLGSYHIYSREHIRKAETLWRSLQRSEKLLIRDARIFTGDGRVIESGSVLIEKVFEIRGMGLLGLEAIISRDYMVFMGILALTSLLSMIGRILSDFCYVLIDPRISFTSEQ